ncbi:hypothetical protein GOBAR_DD27571 [Gossypium barbadense]|nr:hypothetical protein GOBAR_DD27571 [Gossypium barbadense]
MERFPNTVSKGDNGEVFSERPTAEIEGLSADMGKIPRAHDWNKTVFGNIFVRERRALRELERIQGALEHCNSTQLKVREKEIRLEVGNILSQGELLWVQKSICDWLSNGLNTGISIEEVLQAIFSMTPLKALRVNGIHAKFYLAHWDILGGSRVRVFLWLLVRDRLLTNKEQVRRVGAVARLFPRVAHGKNP